MPQVWLMNVSDLDIYLSKLVLLSGVITPIITSCMVQSDSQNQSRKRHIRQKDQAVYIIYLFIFIFTAYIHLK